MVYLCKTRDFMGTAAAMWLLTATPMWPKMPLEAIATRYSLHNPSRCGKHEHPCDPLHYTCRISEKHTQKLAY